MSHEQPSSEHRGHEPGDPEILRPDEVERHLRAQQPRPPQLDFAAIEQAACDAPQMVVRAQRDVASTGRWVGAIAGSWACGAIAGALVMFIMLGQAATKARDPDSQALMPPGETTADHAAVAAKEPDVELAQEPGALDELERPIVGSPRLSALLADLTRMPGADRRPTLRAGAHLSGLDSLPPDNRDAQPPKSYGTTEGYDRTTTRRLPAPAATREQLMREFLRDDFDSVL